MARRMGLTGVLGEAAQFNQLATYTHTTAVCARICTPASGAATWRLPRLQAPLLTLRFDFCHDTITSTVRLGCTVPFEDIAGVNLMPYVLT
jgi:hypothetical protein